jgi:hypothetical protein
LIPALSCGSFVPSGGISPVEFDPDPAVVASGACSSTARIVETAGVSADLVSITVAFRDADGGRGEFLFDAGSLSSVLDSLSLPPHGSVTGTFSFDLGSKGLKVPCEGTMVAVGVAKGAAVSHYVGAFRCEE